MNNSWISLNRAIVDHWIYKKDSYFKAWVSMLIHANFTDQKVLIDGELIECLRGQKLYSLKSWADIFGGDWTVQKVKTFFKLLEKDEMIVTKGLRKTTHTTIKNYEQYQGLQSDAISKVTNRQLTDNSQITHTQLQYNKEKKEINEKNEERRLSNFENWWSSYERKGNRKDALKRFIKLKEEQVAKCLEVVNEYVASTPDKQYRKNGESYLLKESFNDEILAKQETGQTQGKKYELPEFMKEEG